jgi:DNA-binding winged helix-turn-helix (wHTH) protein
MGVRFSVEVVKDRITIGRLAQYNDVSLEPDPQQFVTRKMHCAVERDAGSWWVVDNASVNRTFLRRGSGVQIVEGRAPLTDGDVIRILASVSDKGKPIYWELTFCDPMGTQPAEPTRGAAYLEYQWITARLYRVVGGERQEIAKLRPQEHKLIRYMEQRNRTNGNVPVMCSYEELMAAIWGESAQHTETEVNHLIWELRQKIEPQPEEPQFLQTVRGLGYRLETRVTEQQPPSSH